MESSNPSQTISEIINRISTANPTLEPDDIGIILLDTARQSYELADHLQQTLARQFNWPVNKAYETKSKVPGHIFISNKNNVKGLEFPFVICVTSKISSSCSYRNALYMTLSRSFLKSYLILSKAQDADVLSRVRAGLEVINSEGYIEVQPPTEEERKAISTKIKRSSPQLSYYDFLEGVFDDLAVIPLFREKLRKTVINTLGEEFDYNSVMEVDVLP